ncbi:hypothetical protein [Aequorivita capsosiphonis]|uniref:hypothetical protein n=1 Tax=Aequorivita capsosiphonis TaxID=487317 RepID=UPI000411C9CF|nr:hypothetical protein [Aequorivita capsosiphonis]
MKKLLFSVLITSLLFTTSCKKDDDGGGGTSCEARALDISNAAQTFIDNPNSSTCENYRSALQKYLNANCPGSESYQDDLDDIDCAF